MACLLTLAVGELGICRLWKLGVDSSVYCAWSWSKRACMSFGAFFLAFRTELGLDAPFMGDVVQVKTEGEGGRYSGELTAWKRWINVSEGVASLNDGDAAIVILRVKRG